ncbi:MAG: 23S rRNA (pseudouridine(1915)-N(3))-methyltransferase RlmH [Holophagales bacterium]|nr:23S rRNA (pseudouridine(1915)-N(3))-methyltransferase RlmH [Holophagales bacterium]
MYPIRLIVVGKPKAEPIILLEKHYKKLIRPYARLEVIEIPEGKGQHTRQLLDEAARIKNALSGFQRPVLLSATGQQSSSEEFASWLGSRMDSGESLAFAIGSSHGFHPSLNAEISERVALSAMTFPHDLCRIMFLEQLYRAFAILRGGAYHK